MGNAVAIAEPEQPTSGRPRTRLPMAQLLNLSVYWAGINAIWAGLGTVVWQARMTEQFGEALAPTYVTLLETLPVFIAILVQPTVGALSDYTMTRWGRRKPYIVIGTLLDMVFLWAIASSLDFVAIFVFLVLLQVSSNFAQGPFQGYVPDLVPAQQVGTASGLMGVMIVIGQVAGVAIAAIGVGQLAGNPFPRGTLEAGEFARQAFFLPTIALGLIELLTMFLLVLFVREGRGAPPRDGRSLWRIALGAWGTDILRERSYVWLLVSRLFFLMAPSVVIFLGLFYLRQSLGTPAEAADEQLIVIVAVMGALTGVATLPAARLSDRIGRKDTIYLAIAVGIVGLAGVALAPSFEVTVLALIPVGVSAGAFLAVDWALMTDIIPKATAGRYMGISAVATGASGPFGRLLAGPLLTLLVLAGLPPELHGVPTAASESTLYGAAPRIVMGLGIVYLLISAWALTKVDERRRED